MRGDEFQSWVEAVETGHTVVRNKGDGAWEYAEASPDGSVKASGVRVLPHGAFAPAFIQPGIRPPRDDDRAGQMSEMIRQTLVQRKAAAAASGKGRKVVVPDSGAAQQPEGSIGQESVGSAGQLPEGAPGDWVPVSVSGPRNLLVVLVNFANRTLTTTAAGWNGTIFDTTPGVLSVANYYHDNSFGTLTITPAAHSQAGNPQGIVTVTIADNHPNSGNIYNYATETTILNHALAQAAAHVDFSSFDANANGTLEPSELSVYFIYAGYEDSGSNNTPKIWAHAWSGTLVAGGVNITRWALNGELNNADLQHPIGVIAHELGHAMCGLPDLYDTASHNAGMGAFSLMASGSWGADSGESGGTRPTVLDAWSREYLGWTAPASPVSNGSVSFGAALASANNAVRLVNAAATTSEYWLAENRLATQGNGWDRGVRALIGNPAWAGGLLLTHIDVTVGTQGSNDINRYVAGSHQGVMPEQASTLSCNMFTTTCAGNANTLFYSTNNNSFNNTTTPNSKYYSGVASFRALDNISATGATMTADYSQGGAAPTGSIKINAGTTHTNGLTVTLNLLATVAAPSTVKDMRFSNDGATWSVWETYKTTRSWALDAGSDGDRSVYAQFRDTAGNESVTYSDAITLDTTAPDAVIVVSGALVSPTKATVISFGASNSDVVAYKYKMDSGLWSVAIPVTTTVNYTGLATGNHTLSLIGKDAAGNWQSATFPATVSWTVDATRPVTTASPAGGNYSANQSVTLAASEAATIYYTTNGTAPTTASPQYGGPISISTTTTLKYFAVDGVGNAEAVKSQIYKLPPTATVTGAATVTKLTTATLTVGGAGVLAYKYKLDGGAYSAEMPISTKISLSGLSVGAHTVSVIGKNSLGLWQSTATTVSWTIEQTAPVTTASLADGVYPPNQTVTLTANEAGTIFYTLNGTTPSIASAKYSVPLTVKTSATLKFFAVDLAGNAEAVKIRSYTITTVTGTPLALTKLAGATLTVGGTGVVAYKYALDGGVASAETPVATKIALAGLASGAHTVTVLGKKADGTWQVTPTGASWTVDGQVPSTTASPAGGTYGVAQSVTLAASETAKIYYTTNGATPTTASFKYTAPITIASSATLKFFAVDSAGNAEAVKSELYSVPPTATVSGAPPALTKLTAATLTVGGTGVVAYKYALDGGAESTERTTATKIALSALSAGAHTISVVGRNSAGLWQSVPTTVNWTIEQTAPVTTASLADGVYSPNQTVTLAASEAGIIYYTTNGYTPTTASAKYTGPLTIKASTTLKYFAVDTAGNAEAVKTRSYTIITVTGTPPALTKLTTATLTVGGIGVVSYKYRVDGGVESAERLIATKIALTGVSNGAHTVTVLGKKADGTWQAAPTSVSWTVDTQAPATTASVLAGTYDTPQTATLSASEAATIYYTTTGVTPTIKSAKYTAALSIPTTTTLKYFAVDTAGNAESVKSQVYSLPPTATISGISDTVSAGTPVTLTVGGTYVTAYKYSLDNSAWTYVSSVSASRTLGGVSAGTHSLKVAGKNAAGTWQPDVDATVKVWTVN